MFPPNEQLISGELPSYITIQDLKNATIDITRFKFWGTKSDIWPTETPIRDLISDRVYAYLTIEFRPRYDELQGGLEIDASLNFSNKPIKPIMDDYGQISVGFSSDALCWPAQSGTWSNMEFDVETGQYEITKEFSNFNDFWSDFTNQLFYNSDITYLSTTHRMIDYFHYNAMMGAALMSNT